MKMKIEKKEGVSWRWVGDDGDDGVMKMVMVVM